jgi:DNA-binding winged helix-turn-helix (wHTH) protein
MQTHSPGARVFRFGVFELDAESGELRRHGLKIRLPDQSLKVLKALLSRPGDVVARDELRYVLWAADTFVDFELGLNSAVRKLREALDDSADAPRFVETLPRRGYRFVGAVTAPLATPRPFDHVEELDEGPAAVSVAGPIVPRTEPAPGAGPDAVSAPAAESVAPVRSSRGIPVRAAGIAVLMLMLGAAAAYQREGLAPLRS